MPQAMPVAEPMVPIPGVLLDHVPPPVAFVSAVHDPTQTVSEPVIVAGSGFTETVVTV